MKKISEMIYELKKDVGMFTLVECTQQEKEEFKDLEDKDQLPENIHHDFGLGTYFKKVEIEMTPEQKEEFYTLKKLSFLKSIKGYLKFFVVLTVISLLCALIVIIAGGSVLNGLFY